jgi:hypothetical protein
MTFFSSLLSSLAMAVALLQVPQAIATFDGVFKTANSKFVEIQVESGDTMRMYLTHGTKFVKDGHAAKVKDFHDGDRVTVDAERDVRLNLLAVKIESAKPETKPKQP